jgi:ABC-type glucose/galactose transport system permease subunit
MMFYFVALFITSTDEYDLSECVSLYIIIRCSSSMNYFILISLLLPSWFVESQKAKLINFLKCAVISVSSETFLFLLIRWVNRLHHLISSLDTLCVIFSVAKFFYHHLEASPDESLSQQIKYINTIFFVSIHSLVFHTQLFILLIYSLLSNNHANFR